MAVGAANSVKSPLLMGNPKLPGLAALGPSAELVFLEGLRDSLGLAIPLGGEEILLGDATLGGGLATPELRAGGATSGVAVPSKLPSTCALVTLDEVGEGLLDPNCQMLLASSPCILQGMLFDTYSEAVFVKQFVV